MKDLAEDDAGEWRRGVEWLSVVVGAVDELVADFGIGIVKVGISLVADITGSLLGRGDTGSTWLSKHIITFRGYRDYATPSKLRFLQRDRENRLLTFLKE
jgi:hypothetical protein